MMAWLSGHADYRVLGRSLQLSPVIRASCVRKLSSMEREVEGTNQVGKDPQKAFEYIFGSGCLASAFHTANDQSPSPSVLNLLPMHVNIFSNKFMSNSYGYCLQLPNKAQL